MNLTGLFSDAWAQLRSHRTHGGIRPETHKTRSLRSVIMQTPLPEYLIIPLTQNRRAAAMPTVQVGDHVLKGQPLTDVADQTGCPVHAPTSGIIEGIGRYPVAAEIPADEPCFLLKSDGNDTWATLTGDARWQTRSPASLVDKIHVAGISELGAAGFSLAHKLRGIAADPLDTLIIDIAECEPYITCDQALARAHTAELLTGVKILQYVTGARETCIAIDAGKSDAIDALRAQLGQIDITLCRVSDRYPAGSEKSLIQQVTGRQVPAGGLPADIGVLVCNAGTAFAVYRAIVLGQPLISRITTLCGDTLATPKNFEVLIGTPVCFLLDLCGVDYERLSAVICGGSMTGFNLTDLKVPIGKGSNCLIAGSQQEFPSPPDALACIRCGYCAEVCPVSLQPRTLYELIHNDNPVRAEQAGLGDCIDCGACAWVCPSHIPLLQYFRHAQSVLAWQGERREQSRHWQQRYAYHQYRLARSDKRKNLDARRMTTAVPAEGVERFDRDRAQVDIAEAVARVRTRRENLIASSGTPPVAQSNPLRPPHEADDA